MSEDINNAHFLIVMRHGEQDEKTGLTERGHQQVRDTAQTLQGLGCSPDLIISSTPGRATKSTQNLRDVFGDTAQIRTQDLIDVIGHFDINDFLATISTSMKQVILSGHSETIEHFGYRLLDDAECAKLFAILPDNRHITIEEREMLLMPKHGDTLIFFSMHNDEEENYSQMPWRLYGWLADGELKKAYDIDPESINIGKKVECTLGGNGLLYELPA